MSTRTYSNERFPNGTLPRKDLGERQRAVKRISAPSK